VIDAKGIHYRELNERIRGALGNGRRRVTLRNVCGQRYIGAGVKTDGKIVVEGVPGNDLGCFMDGPTIIVRGNAQDGVANTMSSGEVVVHGDAGDVLGYSMRGGRVFVRGNAGYRVGIHMKAYRDRVPVVIVGGRARDYFGEYMAGGILVLLGVGHEENGPVAGDFLGTGMHGGEIFVRGRVDPHQLGREVGRVDIDDERWSVLERNLKDYSRAFGMDDEGLLTRERFTRLVPVSSRPYGRLYVY
jgi:glutamate synthase domain-containing protein 3